MPHITDDELLGWRETDQVQREEIFRLRADMEVAIKRIADLERQISDARQYLIPMQSWPDLDDHIKGHIAMMLHITSQKQE